MTFKERISAGLEGKFKGLANGFSRVNKYLFGIQRSCYYLVGALSGGGKSTLVDYMLLNALQDAIKQGITVNVHYYSLEIDELSKRSNWLSVLIYQKYNRIISPETIKGLGEFRLTAEEQEIVNSEIEELEKIWSKIHWYWEAINPTGIRNDLWKFMEKRGKFIRESYIDEKGDTKERIVKFVNDNSEEYNIVILDHQALMKCERRDGRMFTTKENIDKWSEYCVTMRNLFGMTFFNIQQFNQGLSSVDRQKFKGVDISPQQSDFRDTTSPYADCDVALGLMNAHKMDMDTCLGYNINSGGASYNLKDRFRMLKIIKNRLSRDNIAIGLLFQAEAGRFEELPQPQDIRQDDIIKINKLVKR
jgi:replicative DNA helicase